MKASLILLMFIVSICFAQAQDHESHNDHDHIEHEGNARGGFGLGLEQDVLPYILGGYIVTAWVGKNHLRGRFSFAKSNIPAFYRDDLVTKDRVTAYGINLEYFIKDDFKGLWFGMGYGMWTNDVSFVSGNIYKNLSNIISIGGGYNYHLTKRIYVSPWLALHSRVEGNEEIILDNDRYVAPRLTPEVSMKIGLRLF